MQIGALIFATDLTIAPARLAREMEDRGYDSMWMVEHTHIPVSRVTPWPGGPVLPDEYARTLDPFVTLTAAATVTTRLKVGTGISLVAQHHPLTLAKADASLDHLSGGRVLFGIGIGWNIEEMEHHGVDPSRRRSIVRENVLAMKALWTQDEASFDGEFVSFSPSWSWPKPIQRPHPPVIMGGNAGPITFRHIIEYCDGWMPIHGRKGILDQLGELRRQAADAGRDPASIEFGVFGCPGDPAVIERYREAGATRVVLGLPSADESSVLRVLDAYQGLFAN